MDHATSSRRALSQRPVWAGADGAHLAADKADAAAVEDAAQVHRRALSPYHEPMTTAAVEARGG
ncbi:MAG: hypothetical protein R2851_18860 [Caldilineaceae bacterium]